MMYLTASDLTECQRVAGLIALNLSLCDANHRPFVIDPDDHVICAGFNVRLGGGDAATCDEITSADFYLPDVVVQGIVPLAGSIPHQQLNVLCGSETLKAELVRALVNVLARGVARSKIWLASEANRAPLKEAAMMGGSARRAMEEAKERPTDEESLREAFEALSEHVTHPFEAHVLATQAVAVVLHDSQSANADVLLEDIKNDANLFERLFRAATVVRRLSAHGRDCEPLVDLLWTRAPDILRQMS